KQIVISIRTLAYLAHPADIRKQFFPMPVFIIIGNFNPGYMHTCEGSHKQVMLPAGVSVPGIKKQPAGADGGYPIMYRLLHAGLLGEVGDDGTIVVYSISDNRPAVIPAFLDDVQFVTAPWPVLRRINDVIYAIIDQALYVTVSIRPDAVLSVRMTCKRIILWDTAVV